MKKTSELWKIFIKFIQIFFLVYGFLPIYVKIGIYMCERWCNQMTDVATACFFKRYYPHVIKWWLVTYNPEVFRIWPSPEEKEEALRIEAEEERLALEQKEAEASAADMAASDMSIEDSSAYNATTGSYSGLYGQKPVDADTQAALDAILSISSYQGNVDSLISGGVQNFAPVQSASSSSIYSSRNTKEVVLPPEQDEIIKEANAIYERLMREAAEDEAKKQAEIEAARQEFEASLTS